MAGTAIELSPENAWAHGANAWVKAVSGDLDEALTEARLAIELSPQDGHVLDLAGITAVLVNAPDLAAEVSNPNRPRSGAGRFGANNIWGVSQYMLGNYTVTIEAFTDAPASGAPVSAPTLVFLAAAYDHIGKAEEAERLVEELNETWADFPSNLILSRTFQNETAFERDILERLSKHGYQKD
jgi:tetratricopeptide (TPR) repeat protein